jgi:hypothetical protein
VTSSRASHLLPLTLATSQESPCLLQKRKLTASLGPSTTDLAVSTVRNVGYAEYGVTNKVINFSTEGRKICIVLCKGWPSWFWAARSRGFGIKLVVLSDLNWRSIVKVCSPETSVVSRQHVGKVDWHFVDTIFSDYDLQGKLIPLWNYFTNHLVLMKPTWMKNIVEKHTKLLLIHAQCGGVSDVSLWVHIYTKAGNMGIAILPQAPRYMGTIIDPMNSLGHPCPAPKLVKASTGQPQVIEIWPGSYHCKGLLPWATHLVWIIAPSVFSPTSW